MACFFRIKMKKHAKLFISLQSDISRSGQFVSRNTKRNEFRLKIYPLATNISSVKKNKKASRGKRSSKSTVSLPPLTPLSSQNCLAKFNRKCKSAGKVFQQIYLSKVFSETLNKVVLTLISGEQ
jgi:hypothetical protein